MLVRKKIRRPHLWKTNTNLRAPPLTPLSREAKLKSRRIKNVKEKEEEGGSGCCRCSSWRTFWFPSPKVWLGVGPIQTSGAGLGNIRIYFQFKLLKVFCELLCGKYLVNLVNVVPRLLSNSLRRSTQFPTWFEKRKGRRKGRRKCSMIFRFGTRASFVLSVWGRNRSFSFFFFWQPGFFLLGKRCEFGKMSKYFSFLLDVLTRFP